jgi:hypothetical protein
VQFTTKGKGKRPVRYHGIGDAARHLGVTRWHVLRVIQGKNQSRRVSEYLRQHLRRAG